MGTHNATATLGTSPATPGLSSPSVLWQELNVDDIELQGVIGQGTYGVVHKALWHGKIVAVKKIETEMEPKSFLTEVQQLSRVKHENIINLYGACMNKPIYLVMEFAEGGSLSNVLHPERGAAKASYTAAHAMSWQLQSAKAVEYLHSLKVVHRDLKPPNLLLVDQGRKLKICDFGTACDLRTHMTNSRGSAAWMAPEVFTGSTYGEKCDVFSWGIILWEVLTRRKPFAEIGGPAFRVMWAVKDGSRPPSIQNCPKPIDQLMKRCWNTDPSIRPSMAEIVNIMTSLMRFFTGADSPLVYVTPDRVTEDSYDDYTNDDSTEDFTSTHGPDAATVCSDDMNSLVYRGGSATPVYPPNFTFDDSIPVLRLTDDKLDECAKASTASSPSVSSPVSDSHPRGSVIERPEIDEQAIHRENLRLPLSQVCQPSADANGITTVTDSLPESAGNSPMEVPMAFLILDSHIQPLPPCRSSGASMAIFQEHCQLAEDFVRMQEEISILSKKKQELIDGIADNIKEAQQANRYQEYQQLLLEKTKLTALKNTLKDELNAARRQQ